MNSLNDIIRKQLLEYMIRHEMSFAVFAENLKVPEERIVLWVSGSHDFSLNEISLIESSLNIRLITRTATETNSYGKTSEDITLLIDQSLHNLSVRSQNIIQKLRQEYDDPFKLLAKINEAIEGKYNLPMAGKKTLGELKDYNHWLSVNMPDIEIKGNDQIDYLNLFCQKHKLSHSLVQRISSRMEENKPTLFLLFNDIIKYSGLYNKTFKEVFSIYTAEGNDTKEMPFAEASDLLIVTRERVRQLRNKVDEEIVNIGISLKEVFVMANIKKQYPLLFESPFISLDKNLSSEFNTGEGVKLSIKTIGLLLKGLFYPEVELLMIKTSTIYLVPAKWTSVFKFLKLEEKVKSISAMSVWDRQEYFWDRIYADMIVVKNDSSIPDILKFVNYLLKVEYGFIDSSSGEISGIRPKHLSLIEKIYLAISHYNEPIGIDKIIAYINDNFPQTKFTKSTIHAALIRSRLVMTFGKSGTYGLKEWEGKRDNIKSGSIADLVYSHLESCAKPLHIQDIHFYISQFRKTTKRSILSIMSMDTNQRFELYGHSFYGVTGKNYDVEDTAPNPINNRTIHEVRRLLSENGALPYIKVEQYIIKAFGIMSSQANHLLDEAVKSGRLKLIEGNIHLPTWIQGGLKREIKLNAYHIEQNRLAMEQQKEMDKHPASLEEYREMQKRFDRAWREMQRNKGINPGNK